MCWALENRMSNNNIPSLRRDTWQARKLPLHAGPLRHEHFQTTIPEQIQAITLYHNLAVYTFMVHSTWGPC